MLLDRGAQVNAKESWHGQTALMWAAGEGHAAAVDELIRRGAEVDARSNGGLTPLLFAARGNHVGVVRALAAAGANVNAAAPDGTSALALAIVNANYDVAGLLLEKGADPNAADPRGSALHALTWMRNPGYAAAPPRVSTGTARQPDPGGGAARTRRQSQRADRLEGDQVRSRQWHGQIASQHLRSAAAI